MSDRAFDLKENAAGLFQPSQVWPVKTVNSNIILEKLINYFIDTTTERILTLPLSPLSGDEIHIFDQTASAEINNITVVSNNLKINGIVQDLTIDVNGAGVILSYTGSDYGWKVA